MKFIFTIAIYLFLVSSVATAQTSTLKGTVRASSGAVLSHISLQLDGNSRGTMTNEQGEYSIDKIPYGKYRLILSGVEVKRKEVTIHVDKATIHKDITLELADENVLGEAFVSRQTKKKELETSGFSLAVIETKQASLRNLTTNELLDRSVGVRVRQNGGIGSEVEYNLNGMTGSTIGLFLDGIELSTYGSSFNLNNIPPSMIERIEVYKGVLPSHLTGDYVGGAINVVLKKDASQNNITLSTSYGSFNTFTSDIGVNFRDKQTGFSFRGSGFYTYTDNDYEMWGKFTKYTDRNGILTRDFKAKRFNNTYKSIGGRFEAGFTDVKWADQFFLGYNISDTYSEIPHGTTTSLPYVGRYADYQAHVFSLNYIKRNLLVDGLSLGINAVRSNRSTYVQDTVSTLYNWDGNPIVLHTDYMIEAGDPPKIIKSPTGAQQGEPTITQTDRKILNARSNLAYSINANHRISINHKIERTDRDDTDLLLPVNKDFLIVTQLTKNIVSANYEAQTFKDRLRTNVMVKYTSNRTKQTDPKVTYNTDGSYQLNPETKNTFTNNVGYGATVSYNILRDLFVIASFENSYIAPTEEQMFGNLENNIMPNLNLAQEKDINYNLGFRWGGLGDEKHKVSLYGNVFWRNGYDKITRQTVDSIVTETDMDLQATAFANIDIQSRGFEGEIVYDFDNKLNAILNFSKFNALYKRKYDKDGNPDDRYNLQVPNEPYFTINANVQYRLNNIFQRKSILNLFYNAGYVGDYNIAWFPSEQGFTPSQLSHDIGTSYRFPSNKLVISLDAKNIFNKALYDNFGVQKPGRGFYLKLNYTINKFL